MDTRRPTAEEIEKKMLAEIKEFMPETYKSIQQRAAPGEIGNAAFSFVRRGLRGEANCFYAFERGRIVGTPFDWPEIEALVAVSMVTFGLKHCVILPSKLSQQAVGMVATGAAPQPGGLHGTH